VRAWQRTSPAPAAAAFAAAAGAIAFSTGANDVAVTTLTARSQAEPPTP
jgi:hypothetical protein